MCCHEKKYLLISTCCGLRFSSTNPSIMAGSWASIKELQIASRSGSMDPRAWHNCDINLNILTSYLCSTDLLGEIHNLLLCCVAGQELINICYYINTDGAGEGVVSLLLRNLLKKINQSVKMFHLGDLCKTCGHQAGEDEQGCLHSDGQLCDWELRELSPVRHYILSYLIVLTS